MLDLSKLKRLMGGDEAMVRKFLEIFKTQTPQQLAGLKQCMAQKDWQQASIIAHAIKSQCQYVGLDKAAELASGIESLAENQQQLPLIPELFEQLEAELEQVLQ